MATKQKPQRAQGFGRGVNVTLRDLDMIAAAIKYNRPGELSIGVLEDIYRDLNGASGRRKKGEVCRRATELLPVVKKLIARTARQR